MNLSFNFSGGADFEKLQRQLEEEFFSDALKSGTQMEKDVIASLSVTGGPGLHSKPGEPPRKITGALQGSVETNISQADGVLKITVSANTDYAKTLELGNFKIKPRPFMLPALFNAYRVFKERLKKSFKED